MIKNKKVAIVEDNENDIKILKNYIDKYSADENIKVDIYTFINGLDFLDEIKENYDVVFMDIEMPLMNGMETAKKLREMDETVSIIFTTSMVQYAVEGYEVGALDFMVKPITYYNFSKKIKRAFLNSRHNNDKNMILNKDGMFILLSVSDIYYIEKNHNNLIVHSAEGEFKKRGSINQIIEEFAPYGFAVCTSGCLVNLKHIKEIRKDSLVIQGGIIPISRRHKKLFINSFIDYYGGVFSNE